MPRRHPRQSSLHISAPLIGIVVLILVLAVAGFLTSQYLRPLPAVAIHPQPQAEQVVGTTPNLPWPSTGSAAVSVKGFGFLGAHGDEAPRPIASTTKIMTALITLENHPLAPGQPGPVVTITPQDVADYQKDVSLGQSVVPVTAGEKLTELQLLLGLLLPSGNNIADVLAKWDSGSNEAFIAKMNARAAALGMAHTHYDDASGFSPKTVSTPSDLVIVGAAAMADPLFRQTVAMDQTTLPNAGVVHNVNSILGKNGNIGVKTGSTDEAGGCFVSASIQQVAGKPMEIYAAVLGQDRLGTALDATTALTQAVATSLRETKVLSRTDVSATLTPAWGDPIDVVPAQDVDMLVWPGTTLKKSLQLDTVQAPLPDGARVGTVTLELGQQTQQIDVVTTAPIVEPTWQWRATRFLRQQ
jgi:serine-type D-Ala-D-Ala carboxypeptidase (penicillin-binding protein 5/6)